MTKTKMLQFPWHAPFKSYRHTFCGVRGKIMFPSLPAGFDLARNSYVNDAAEVRCFRSIKVVKVGSYSSIGRCLFLVDGDHAVHYASTFPFREFGLCKTAPENKTVKDVPVVENDVWIADGATVMGGVTIGNGAIVAAGAVVSKDVPPYAVVVGCPARVVKYRFDDNTIERFLAVRWWDMPDDVVLTELAPHLADPMEFLTRAENAVGILDAM